MQRFISFFIVIALGVVIWSCSKDSQAPMASGEPEESIAPAGESFNAKLRGDEPESPVTYEITLENLTPATGPASSQPFSPPVLVTHKVHVSLFRLHRYASDELRQIAEDAVNGPMVEKLESSDQVYDVAQGNDVIFPGGAATYTIKAKRGFHKFSLVSMLVNTNDAFTGISKANLPFRGEKVFFLFAYDAGTEKNTELTDHIPGPCCGNPLVRVPTHHRIRFHRGITGNGDLDPATYDWNKKVAKLTIRRID